MAQLLIKECAQYDLRNDTFMTHADEWMKKDGPNGTGIVIFNCGYLINEIKNNQQDLMGQVCTGITYTEWEYDGKILISKDKILLDETLSNKSIQNSCYASTLRYIGKPISDYFSLNLCPKLPIVNDSMSDSEIIDIGKLFYKKAINEKYIGKYAVDEYPLMEQCSLNLEKICSPLELCGTMSGITTGYTYYGCTGSISGLHSEDYSLPSMNINYSGKYKKNYLLFIIISLSLSLSYFSHLFFPPIPLSLFHIY